MIITLEPTLFNIGFFVFSYLLLGIILGPLVSLIANKLGYPSSRPTAVLLSFVWPFAIFVVAFLVVFSLVGVTYNFIDRTLTNFSFSRTVQSVGNGIKCVFMFFFRVLWSFFLVVTFMYVSMAYALVYQERVMPCFQWVFETLSMFT